MQVELPPELLAALHPVLREVSRRESPEVLQASLQRVASWVPASAQRRWVLAGARRQDAAASRHARRAQPEARPVDAEVQAPSMVRQAVSRPMARVLRLVLPESAVPGVQPEAVEVQSSARVQPSELPQVAEGQPWVPLLVAVEAQPSEALAVAAEQPSVARVAEVVRPLEAQAAARPSVLPAEAEGQPLEVPVAAEVQRAAEAVEEEQPSAVRVAAAQPSAVQAVAQGRPSEAPVELPSAEPSVRSGPQVLRPVRRRSTMSRREPEAARAERQRSQSSSTEGVECSSWGLWGEKKVKQPESCRPSQRSELRSVDSD
ncbi:hypothetical protein [Afipia massiliensis]|uniref:hypothetical protein n=1 Tax=Afipia massiliensis TaxID=211460 RepID=UPI0032E398F0